MSISNPRGILRFCPDLRKTPSLSISCPEGVENITKRINSEEGRINDPSKVQDLLDLRDFVFRARVDEFHWRVDEIVETASCRMYPRQKGGASSSHQIDLGEGTHLDPELGMFSPELPRNGDEEDTVQPHLSTPATLAIASQKTSSVASREAETVNKQIYVIGHFVVIRNDDDDDGADSASCKKIWIGQVLQVNKKEGQNYAHSLKVHWFDRSDASNDGRDILRAVFNPCYQPTKRKMRKASKGTLTLRQKIDEPWTDIVHTDTVLMTFPSLTKRRCLPLAVQSKILS